MKINWKNKIYKRDNKDFLTYKSSITNKISKKANLKIQRNKSFPNTILNDEKLFFKTSRSGSLFLREVLIYADDSPIIYARTVFKKNLRQLTSIVKKLNENPLANIVFKKKTSRSEFIFSHLSPNYKLAKKQMKGFGAMLSFELIDGIDAMDFQNALKLIKPSLSLAGLESTTVSPAQTTHALLSAEERLERGIKEGLIRFSVGIEESEDLIEDIAQAIKSVHKRNG